MGKRIYKNSLNPDGKNPFMPQYYEEESEYSSSSWTSVIIMIIILAIFTILPFFL